MIRIFVFDFHEGSFFSLSIEFPAILTFLVYIEMISFLSYLLVISRSCKMQNYSQLWHFLVSFQYEIKSMKNIHRYIHTENHGTVGVGSTCFLFVLRYDRLHPNFDRHKLPGRRRKWQKCGKSAEKKVNENLCILFSVGWNLCKLYVAQLNGSFLLWLDFRLSSSRATWSDTIYRVHGKFQ